MLAGAQNSKNLARLQRISLHFPEVFHKRLVGGLIFHESGPSQASTLLASHVPIYRREAHAHRQPAWPDPPPCPVKCSRIWSAPTMFVSSAFSPRGQQTPTGEWFDQDEHEWVLLVQGEAILVFITPDTGYRNASIWGRGLHQHPGAPSAQGGVDPSDRDNRLALRLLLASSRLKKAMLLLRRSKRRPWRRKKAQSVDWAS